MSRRKTAADYFGEHWGRWAMLRGIELDLRPTTRFVLLVMAEHVNRETRTAWPSYDWVEEVTGLRRSAVAAALKEIRDAGAMASSGSRGTGASAEYWPLESAQPDASSSSDPDVPRDVHESVEPDGNPSGQTDSSHASAQPDAMESARPDRLESVKPDTEVRVEGLPEDQGRQPQEVRRREVDAREHQEIGVIENGDTPTDEERVFALLLSTGATTPGELLPYSRHLTARFDGDQLSLTVPAHQVAWVSNRYRPALEARGLTVEVAAAEAAA